MIIQNAVKITCLNPPEYLISTHVHDYKTTKLPNGNHVAVDGGNDYFRRGYKTKHDGYEEFNLDDESPFELVCERLLWGRRGKDGKQPLTYKPLAECSKAHLKAILKNVPNINPLHKKVIEFLLKK
jgi:hypothetical protein